MADGDVQPGLCRQGGELGLPGPATVAVGATGVRGDQQPPGIGVGDHPDGVPPRAQGVDRERGGLVVDPDTDPAGVGTRVIDAVRDGLALFAHEVVDVDLLRLTPVSYTHLTLPTILR